MSFKEFLKSRVFWKNAGLALVIGVAIILLLIIFLNIYTHHGQSRPTPEIRGLTIEEARRVAEKNRMRFQIIDSVYTAFVPRGCVAEQMPAPGHRVKKGRTIKVTINAFNPEMVAVPDLVGLPRRQAVSVIETAGLQVGQLTYVPDLTVDFVLKQTLHGREIAPGDSVQKGMAIDLILGRGLSRPAYIHSPAYRLYPRPGQKRDTEFIAQPRSICLRCHRQYLRRLSECIRL